MIIRAAVIVTMDGAPVENGAVRVEGERVIEVGNLVPRAGEQIIELDDCVLLPGRSAF